MTGIISFIIGGWKQRREARRRRRQLVRIEIDIGRLEAQVAELRREAQSAAEKLRAQQLQGRIEGRVLLESEHLGSEIRRRTDAIGQEMRAMLARLSAAQRELEEARPHDSSSARAA